MNIEHGEIYFTVYKIKNIINNKIYIGCHRTKNLDDNYMGSGLLIRRAIEKYGIENFKKEYIEIFDNEEDMFKMESALVNEDFVKDESTYNLKEGGCGGWSYVNEHRDVSYLHSDEHRQRLYKQGIKVKELMSNDEYKKEFSVKVKNGVQKNIKIRGTFNTWEGRKHTEESKRKIGNANSINQLGTNNSMYNHTYVSNVDSKMCICISNDELEDYISDGWIHKRVLDWDLFFDKKRKKEIADHNKKIKRENDEELRRLFYIKLYEKYKESGLTISAFCRKGFFDKDRSLLSKYFKKYIVDF